MSYYTGNLKTKFFVKRRKIKNEFLMKSKLFENEINKTFILTMLFKEKITFAKHSNFYICIIYSSTAKKGQFLSLRRLYMVDYPVFRKCSIVMFRKSHFREFFMREFLNDPFWINWVLSKNRCQKNNKKHISICKNVIDETQGGIADVFHSFV